MISTLKALFEGRRELFKGHAIEKTDWDQPDDRLDYERATIYKQLLNDDLCSVPE